MRYVLTCALLVGLLQLNLRADVVTFTSRANGSWNANATWDQVPDPDPSDATHVFPRLGDLALVSHTITLAAAQETSTLSFSTGTIGLGSNSLTLYAPSTWAAGSFTGATGSLTLTAASGLTLSGSTVKTFSAGTLLSSGLIDLSAGSLIVNGSMIDLNSLGTLNIAATSLGATFNAGTRVRNGALAGSGTINIRGSGTFENLAGGSTWIDITTADTLTVKGNFVHAGTIDLHDAGTGAAAFRIDGNVTLSGSGHIILSSNGDNHLTSVNAADTLTLSAGHTISALATTNTDSQIQTALVNNGLIEADTGNLVLNTYAKTNNAVMRAVNGGTLHVNNITLTNAGTLSALGASTLSVGTATIAGGKIDGGGTVNIVGPATFDGSTSGVLTLDNITVEMNTGETLNVLGSITNNGTILLRDTGGLFAQMQLVGNTVLGGTGTILFGAVDDNRILSAAESYVLTLGPGQLVTTSVTANADSQISAHLAIQGIVEANGGALVLNGYSKDNLNLIRARNGGTLEIDGTVVNNSGTILADAGSFVKLTNSTVNGGRFDGTGTLEIGVGATLNGATSTVRVDGVTFDINTGETLRLNGHITNNGLLQLRDNGGSTAQLRLAGDVLLDGSGSVLFAVVDDNLITTDNEAFVLTVAASQLVTTGVAANLDSQFQARAMNLGTIEANQGRLILNTHDKTNVGLIRARGGGTLELAGITLSNSGTLLADAGSTIELSGATILGGNISGSGTVGIVVNATLNSVTTTLQSDGVTFDINASERLTIQGNLVNNATIQLRDTGTGAAVLAIDGSQTLAGSGTVAFAGGGNNYIDPVTAGDVLTIGPVQTVTSMVGTNTDSQIRIGLVNEGVVQAVGGALVMNTEPKTNAGAMRASGGGDLILSGTTLTSSGAGTIQVLADGRLTVTGGGTLNASAVRNDGTVTANLGQANVGNLDGSGTVVLVAGAASQLTATHIRQGAFVIGGTNAKATILASGGNDATSRLSSISIAGTGKLDLTNNKLIVDYTDTSPLQSVRTLIRTGYNVGSWNGGGIVTSLGNAANLGLGYGERTALYSTFPATFGGQTVDDTSILVKFTYFGDANLDGQVDITDLAALATAWQTSGTWVNGDFDYSGLIDISDLAKLATNWQAGVGAPLAMSFQQALDALGLPASIVPEPDAVALLTLAAAALARRRR